MLKELNLWSVKVRDGVSLAKDFYTDFGSRLPKHPKKVLFVGMGGSGIAGRIMKGFFDKKTDMRTEVITSSTLPAYVSTDSLAFVVSYSGNTWETVNVLESLIKKHIPTVVLAHGGKAIALAQSHNIPYVIFPESLTPRSALGTFLGFLAQIFNHMGFIDGDKMITELLKAIDTYVPLFSERGYFDQFLTMVKDYDTIHVWGVSDDTAAVAYRVATQCNENAKMQAVYSEYPELAHNLLAGITGKCAKNPMVMLFNSEFLPENVNTALDAICEILRKNKVILYKPPVLGDTFHSQLFSMILWGDFASYFLGKERGVTIEAVAVIEELKKLQKETK
jgi:glucose/mannose-6-phosphate isomerase